MSERVVVVGMRLRDGSSGGYVYVRGSEGGRGGWGHLDRSMSVRTMPFME